MGKFLPNPWFLLAALASLLVATAAGVKIGLTWEAASEAKTAKLIADVREQAQLGAADAITGIEIRYTTVNKRLEKEVRENNHIYHDCINTPVAERLLDDARANRPVSPSETVVPAQPGRSESP